MYVILASIVNNYFFLFSEKYMEQRETVKRISIDKDIRFLLSKIEGHISGAKPLISLASR